MIDIAFPDHSFKRRSQNGKEQIFDECRKCWVLLTPEEWVRQNFLQYLVQVKKYPPALIAVEREIKMADVKKRFDIVVFKDALPWLLVECKEMQVQLTEAVLQQILNYNISLRVQYLVITNGVSTFAASIKDGVTWLHHLPDFN